MKRGFARLRHGASKGILSTRIVKSDVKGKFRIAE
jgi:hypothetical protein